MKSIAALILAAAPALAQTFDASFLDRTMRVDVFHTGGKGSEIVALDRVVNDGPWPGSRVHLIDLHRLARHAWTWPLWRGKDLAQLLYSSEVEGVTARDRLRFWRCYLGGQRRRTLGRWLRWWVCLKWQRYRRHNRRPLL